MKCTCPACGRRTEVEPELGDFPTRCERCGALLRKPVDATGDKPLGRSIKTNEPLRAVPIPHGDLAGLLSTPRPVIVENREYDLMPAPQPAPAMKRTLNADSLRELARVQAREKALRKAQLRGSFQALGAVGTVGFTFAVIAGVIAMAIGARSLWFHPTSARADVLQVSTPQGAPAQ